MVYIDTNVIIYILEGHDEFGIRAAELLTQLRSDGHNLVTSTVTIAEFLASTHKDVSEKEILGFPNLVFSDLSTDIAVNAGGLLKEYRSLRLGDCIHIATALKTSSDILVTNDKEMAKIAKKFMGVKLLS